MIFKDRTDAAQRLAHKLEKLELENPVILAIPRGGVITGDVIAKQLGLPLDVIVSRKIGAPHNPELAIGAVFQDGTFYPNSELIASLGIEKKFLEIQIKEQILEIQRRLVKFRGRNDYQLKDKTVIIVDDGIATGATVFVSVDWLKRQHPKRIIVAVPVGPKDTIEKLESVAEVVVLHDPVFFGAVGEFYQNFEQVEDAEVVSIMSSYGFNAKS